MKTMIMLSSGDCLQVSALFVGNDFPLWDDYCLHPHFKVKLKVNDKSTHVDYWASRNDYANKMTELDENGLLDAVCAFCLDAMSYNDDEDQLEWLNANGYEWNDDMGIKSFKACKKEYEKYLKLFGENWNVYDNVMNVLDEK